MCDSLNVTYSTVSDEWLSVCTLRFHANKHFHTMKKYFDSNLAIFVTMHTVSNIDSLLCIKGIIFNRLNFIGQLELKLNARCTEGSPTPYMVKRSLEMRNFHWTTEKFRKNIPAIWY